MQLSINLFCATIAEKDFSTISLIMYALHARTEFLTVPPATIWDNTRTFSMFLAFLANLDFHLIKKQTSARDVFHSSS